MHEPDSGDDVFFGQRRSRDHCAEEFRFFVQVADQRRHAGGLPRLNRVDRHRFQERAIDHRPQRHLRGLAEGHRLEHRVLELHRCSEDVGRIG